MAILNKDNKPIGIGSGHIRSDGGPVAAITPEDRLPPPDATIQPVKPVATPSGAIAGAAAGGLPVTGAVQAPATGAGAIAGAAAGGLPATGAVPTPQPTPTPTPTPQAPQAPTGGTPSSGGASGGAPAAVPTPQTPTTPGGSGGISGGSSVQLPGATDHSDWLREIYDMQREATMRELEDRYNAAVAELEHSGAKIPGYYQEAVRQTAGQNEIERRAMNEQFAASGLNTGTAGQAALSQNIASQGEIAALRQAEANALSEIEFSRAQMLAEYQAAVRQALLNNDIAKAEALYAEAIRLDEAAVQQALNQAQLDYQARMEELAALETRAEMLASIGDFSGYAALGYSAAEIAALEQAWQTAYGTTTGGTGGGYTGGGYDTHGMGTEEIMALQQAAGIAVDGIWGPQTQAAWEAMQLGTNVDNITGAGTNNGTGTQPLTFTDELAMLKAMGASREELAAFIEAAYAAGDINSVAYWEHMRNLD